MRILYQHRTLADGAEGIHIQEMVEAFRALGHEVIVHALAGSPGEGKPNRWGRIKAALPPAVFELCAIAYNVVDYWTFRRALRQHRPDLIYKRHALYDLGVMLAACHANVPAVLEVNAAYSSAEHQQFELVRFKGFARFCEKHAVRLAELVVAVSTPLKELVQDYCARADRAMVLPNGANPDRFSVRSARRDLVRERYRLGSSLVIGWVGILREWHRVDLLVQALMRVRDARLLIIGDGPDRPRLERVAAEVGVADRVVFTGRVPHTEMPDYIAATDIAVASDDRTGYASPMKLLEYMAMERPVVAPRMRNVEDVVDDGVDGVLFTPGSADDLAAALNRLGRDPEFRRAAGRQARAKIERERNWRRNAETVLAALEPPRAQTSSRARIA